MLGVREMELDVRFQQGVQTLERFSHGDTCIAIRV